MGNDSIFMRLQLIEREFAEADVDADAFMPAATQFILACLLAKRRDGLAIECAGKGEFANSYTIEDVSDSMNTACSITSSCTDNAESYQCILSRVAIECIRILEFPDARTERIRKKFLKEWEEASRGNA